MKLTADPRTLRDAIKVARRIMPRRSTLPVLEHALLTVRDGSLIVESTNLEARACRVVPAVTAEAGAVCLPARSLYNVLGAIDREVSFELVPGKPPSVRVTGDGVDLTIPAIDAAEFPAAPELGERDGTLTLEARTFRPMIEAATLAAAPEDSRPVLAGVQLSAGDGGLTVAAADGFRLRTETVEAWPGNLSALVPAPILREIVRSLKPADMLAITTHSRTRTKAVSDGKSVTTYVDRTFRLATPDGSWWTSRVIEGQFPNYRRIIPAAEAIKTRMTVKAADLKRATDLAVQLGHQILRLTPGSPTENQLAVVFKHAEDVSGMLTLPAQTSGAVQQIAVCPRTLRDALAGCGESATLEIVGPAAPMIVRPAESRRILHVVMPMHAI